MISIRTQRRSRRFMLTPLVDVVFLLLTFFMLSSHVSPYSLLSLLARQAAPDGAPAAPASSSDVAGLIVSISRGMVQADGRGYSPAEFAAAATELGRAAGGVAVVLTKSSATVQDVVTVLEILKASQFSAVSVRTRPPSGAISGQP